MTNLHKKEIAELTQLLNEQEEWKVMLEEELADNPQLLNHMKSYIEKEISFYNEEIKKCNKFQEKVKLYRKSLYLK